MKIKIILIVPVIICLNVFNTYAQEKITIVTERVTTTYEERRTYQGRERVDTKSRSSVMYNFKLGDDGKVMSTGKKGRDLRKHIQDEEALKYFDKSMKQIRWGNRTFLGMLGGMVISAVGFSNPGEKLDDQGSYIGDSVNPLLIVGGVVFLGSLVARPILFKKFDKNFAKSIELHNNTVSSGSSSQNIRIENVGFTLDNRTSRPQLYLSWRF